MSDRDVGNFVTGMVIGAAIGLAVGFLFAPQSGQETRQMLKHKAELARDKAADITDKVKKATSNIKDKLQSQLD